MVRYILLAVFALVVVFLGYSLTRAYIGYKNLSQVPQEYVMGNPNGDLTVVEFLDYTCIYCRQAHPTITEAVRRDGNVRYIIRPVVSMQNPDSMIAAQLVYAAGEQGRFVQMHEALITNERPLGDSTVSSLAALAGVNAIGLKQAQDGDSVTEFINDNLKIFDQIGVRSTPTFIVGRKIKYVPEGRMPEVSDFLSMFSEARALDKL